MTIDKNELRASDVCGVVVTYNGNKAISTTLERLVRNVTCVVLVDNGSTDNTLEIVNSINASNINVISIGKNMGIAYALNRGAEYAKELGFDWILTMDQDSFIFDNMIEEMCHVYNSLPDKQQDMTVCLAAQPIFNSNYIRKSNSQYYMKNYAITSGNVVKVNHLESIGGYEEALFIDSVDFDFCLRTIKEKKKIIVCANAHFYHEIGEMTNINILGHTFVRISYHSPRRKYYIARNHIFILNRYFRTFPWFCIKKTLAFLLFILKIIVLEPNKVEGLHMIFIGIKDGLKNNYGEIEVDGKI